MFGSILGGIGKGILGGIATGFVSDWFNRRAEKRTFNDNANLSWQMWHAQNAYNTPAAQMQRFREAGLNPNLIYGQTNTSAPISVPSSKGTPPQFNALLDAQLKNMEMQNSSVAQQIAQSRQQMELAKMSTMSNLAYQQAQIAGQQLNNQAQKSLLAFASERRLPPAVVLEELKGGVGSMLFKKVKDGIFNPDLSYLDELEKEPSWSDKFWDWWHDFRDRSHDVLTRPFR